jgi:hypothetical protein
VNSPQLNVVRAMMQAGCSDAEIQGYLDAFAKSVTQASPGASRTRRWRKKKLLNSLKNQKKIERHTVTSPVTQKEDLPHTPSKKNSPSFSQELFTDLPEEVGARAIGEFRDAYNICAKELGWVPARKINPTRSVAIKRCIADSGGLEQAFEHLNDLANSRHGQEFGAGANDREWRIDIDYVIRRSKWMQIMEGKFNGVQPQEEAARHNGLAASHADLADPTATKH